MNKYYYRARYYDSRLSWLNRDSYGFIAKEYNLYRYVNNNPVILNDPSGKCGKLCILGFGIIAGGIIARCLDEIAPNPPKPPEIIDSKDICEKEKAEVAASCASGGVPIHVCEASARRICL